MNGLQRHRVTHAAAGTAKWLSSSFSPDGKRIQAGRVAIVDGEQQNADVFTLNLDGSGRLNVTNTPNRWESASDWGPEPVNQRCERARFGGYSRSCNPCATPPRVEARC